MASTLFASRPLAPAPGDSSDTEDAYVTADEEAWVDGVPNHQQHQPMVGVAVPCASAAAAELAARGCRSRFTTDMLRQLKGAPPPPPAAAGLAPNLRDLAVLGALEQVADAVEAGAFPAAVERALRRLYDYAGQDIVPGPSTIVTQLRKSLVERAVLEPRLELLDLLLFVRLPGTAWHRPALEREVMPRLFAAVLRLPEAAAGEHLRLLVHVLQRCGPAELDICAVCDLRTLLEANGNIAVTVWRRRVLGLVRLLLASGHLSPATLAASPYWQGPPEGILLMAMHDSLGSGEFPELLCYLLNGADQRQRSWNLGAWIEVIPGVFKTAAHFAVGLGCVQCAALLAAHGANMDAVFHLTPVSPRDEARSLRGRQHAVLRRLASHSLDWTPLHFAAYGGLALRVLALLRATGDDGTRAYGHIPSPLAIAVSRYAECKRGVVVEVEEEDGHDDDNHDGGDDLVGGVMEEEEEEEEEGEEGEEEADDEGEGDEGEGEHQQGRRPRAPAPVLLPRTTNEFLASGDQGALLLQGKDAEALRALDLPTMQTDDDDDDDDDDSACSAAEQLTSCWAQAAVRLGLGPGPWKTGAAAATARGGQHQLALGGSTEEHRAVVRLLALSRRPYSKRTHFLFGRCCRRKALFLRWVLNQVMAQQCTDQQWALPLLPSEIWQHIFSFAIVRHTAAASPCFHLPR